MADTYRIYKTNKLGVTRDGGTLEQLCGCNGVNHAAYLTVVYYEAGEVEHAKELLDVVMGPCDGDSCCSLGSFIL